jgi:hypothetical protein
LLKNQISIILGCANVDKPEENKNMKLWEKTTITYRVLSYPVGLNSSDVKFVFLTTVVVSHCDFYRELIAQAFRAWEIVIALDFLEARREVPLSEIDIVFEFSDKNELNKNDLTGRDLTKAKQMSKLRLCCCWCHFAR